MKSDPNALKHADFGMATCFFTILLFVLGFVPAILILIAPFLTGVAIEVVQRVQRYVSDSEQNTNIESLLDIMQTGLFYVTFYVNRGKE